jgi:UDP-glucose 4-epimerase
MSKVLVTGGCGYIGSHTIVELITGGYDAVSIDSNARSSEDVLDGVEAITGRRISNFAVDLCDLDATRSAFAVIGPVDSVIHFAAFKSVPESVHNPLLYYHNNIASLVNVLRCMQQYGVHHLVFSSSCSVYGNVESLPVTEETPLPYAESPYAYTKQIGERMVQDVAATSEGLYISLRYFNPAGAHPSGLIGEVPLGPQNLVPAITRTAIGELEELVVHGDDYPTRDGTCIRDYIHVSDIASAHVHALRYLESGQAASNYDIVNLGTGNGVSVREMIDAFERVSGRSLPYRVGPRRAGDVVSIYADNSRAQSLLGWKPRFGVDDMMASAWKWELALHQQA